MDLIPLDPDTLHKLLLTAGVLVALASASWAARHAFALLPDSGRPASVRFWGQQATSLLVASAGVLFLYGTWVGDTKGMSTVIGLVSAGLAVASQKAVTSFAAYFVILRGKPFTVGDYVVLGNVRGKVNSVGFFQTTVFEMGESPAEQAAAPAVWVHGRQFTGRIVTVSNSVIFDCPIYNYTHDFPFVWEEIMLPVSYRDDRRRAQQVLLDAATHHAVMPHEVEAETAKNVQRRYGLKTEQFQPRVYWRVTDNWLEMTVRFVVRATEVRAVKDAIARELLEGLDRAHIGIASSTSEIVGFPPLQVRVDGRQQANA